MSGKGSLIVNPVSGPRAAEKQDGRLAAGSACLAALAGPGRAVRRRLIHRDLRHLEVSPDAEAGPPLLRRPRPATSRGLPGHDSTTSRPSRAVPTWPDWWPEDLCATHREVRRLLAGASQWTINVGHPGPANAAMDEVSNSTRPDMFAAGRPDEASAEESVRAHRGRSSPSSPVAGLTGRRSDDRRDPAPSRRRVAPRSPMPRPSPAAVGMTDAQAVGGDSQGQGRTARAPHRQWSPLRPRLREWFDNEYDKGWGDETTCPSSTNRTRSWSCGDRGRVERRRTRTRSRHTTPRSGGRSRTTSSTTGRSSRRQAKLGPVDRVLQRRPTTPRPAAGSLPRTAQSRAGPIPHRPVGVYRGVPTAGTTLAAGPAFEAAPAIRSGSSIAEEPEGTTGLMGLSTRTGPSSRTRKGPDAGRTGDSRGGQGHDRPSTGPG